MLDWTRIPIGERADLKPRVKAAAKRLGATPRLLQLIDGLGDGDFKADKSEGAGVALRKDKANAWLARQGFNLSADDTDGALVLELAAAVGDELADASLIDLAGAPGDVLDLAPGDYSPPYDWKHGYIPITPAAALSKAKKGPHVGKGNSRRPKGVRVAGKGRVSAPDAGKAKPTTAAGARGKVAGKGSAHDPDNVRNMTGMELNRAGANTTHTRLREAAQRESARRARELKGRPQRRTGTPVDADGKPGTVVGHATTGHVTVRHADGDVKNHHPDKVKDRAQVPAAVAKASDDEDRGRGVPGEVDRAVGSSTLNRAQLEDMAKNGRPAVAAAAKRQLAKLDADKPKGDGSTIPRDRPRGNEAERWAQRNRDEDKRQAQSAANVRDTQAKWTEADKRQLNSLPWSRSSARDGQPAVSYSPKHEQALSDLEQRGLIRMDRRGTSAVADDQYVLTDKGKALAGDTDLHKQTQDRARAQLAAPARRDRNAEAHDFVKAHKGETFTLKTANGRWTPGAVNRDGQGEYVRWYSVDHKGITVDKMPDEATKVGGSPKGGAADSGTRTANREAAGATDTGKTRRLAADRVLLDGQQYERVIGPNGGYTWRGKGNADVKDMETRRKLDEAAPLSGSAVAARRVADNRKAEAEGGPSATPPTRTERAMFPEGQKVAYNGRPSDGTGVVVGRRVDSQGTVLEVRDDKDGKTYEWAPDHVKPHDTSSRAPAKPDSSPAAPASGTMSTNPDAAIRIEHTPDGTLVHGTSREDAAAIKEVGGFKWSRNLNAWYLPRTWRPETREAKVRQLEAKLGDRAGVDKTTGPRKSAAEREADTKARAGERAERMDARADKRSAEAERRFEAADLREEKSGIPFGQPILVGHHSERRHRRALDRAHANMGKGVEAQRDAESARASADRARRTAAGTESKVTIGNRIAKNEREVRDLERRLAGTHSSSRRKPEGEYRQRLEGMLAEAQDQLQHDRGKMTAAGGVPSKDSVSPGDFVKIRGQWYPVRKANAKTVGVPNTYGDRTRTAPWHEVSEHRKAGDVTRADVADMVRDTSQAFPNLAAALAKAAPEKDADTPNAPAAGGFPGRGKLPRSEKADYDRILTRDGKERYYKAREGGASHADALAASRQAPGGPTPANIDRKLSPDAARELSDAELTRRLGTGSSASDADKAVIRAEQQRRSGAATPGGVTPDAARRMSDEQLERTMQRLMADGDYDGPAFSVIEKELNRRDKARRAGPDLSETADQLAGARTRFGVGNGAAVDQLADAIREKRWDDALQRASRLQADVRSNEPALKALQKVMERLSVARRAEGN